MKMSIELKKSISWFMVAFVIQFTLVMFLTGGFTAALLAALGVASSKTVLYFLHEKVWARLIAKPVSMSDKLQDRGCIDVEVV